jgi:hypothetical protein
MARSTLTRPDETTTALAPQTAGFGGALAVRQTADATDKRGKEGLGSEDMILPRLAIAQRTSPEILRGDEKFIEGLEFGQMFNTLTRESYGNGPVRFVPLQVRKRAIEFDENQKVVDFDVPLNDPRLAFGADGQKPVATLFYEIVLVIDRDDETPQLAVLSLKGTQLRTAREFVTLMKMRSGAAWDGAYTIKSATKTYPKGPAGVFKILPSGAPSDDLAAFAEAMYETVQTKNVVTDIDTSREEPDDSDL